MRHPAAAAGRGRRGRGDGGRRGGGIAGIAAATGLAERGVPVVLVEPQAELGGRVRAWPLGDGRTMSRGFHAFFRQYYNLRALLRRADPGLDRLVPIEDYPLVLADGPQDSFTGIPRTPPLNLAAFVAKSPSFTLRDLTRVDAGAAMELLDVAFPATFSDYDGESAATSSTGCASPSSPGTWRSRCSPAASSPTPTTSPPASWSRCSTPTSSARPRACSSTSPTTTTRPRCGGRCAVTSRASASRCAPASR